MCLSVCLQEALPKRAKDNVVPGHGGPAQLFPTGIAAQRSIDLLSFSTHDLNSCAHASSRDPLFYTTTK